MEDIKYSYHIDGFRLRQFLSRSCLQKIREDLLTTVSAVVIARDKLLKPDQAFIVKNSFQNAVIEYKKIEGTMLTIYRFYLSLFHPITSPVQQYEMERKFKAIKDFDAKVAFLKEVLNDK